MQSLFRGANHKKQADFLMRDFSQDVNKAAACKNAFTLLGQHRHELAAAFFVLGHIFGPLALSLRAPLLPCCLTSLPALHLYLSPLPLLYPLCQF